MSVFRAIPLLTASDIDVRVSTVSEKGCSLLLYKDARVDMRILDELFTPLGWQRRHEVVNGNLFCTVDIWDDEKKQWISKQDVGTESYTEKEKGQASDSFKRACFNVGIGRELYTSPFIWVNAEQFKLEDRNGKKSTYDKFAVSSIGYDENRVINSLTIINKKTGKTVFKMGQPCDARTGSNEPPTDAKAPPDSKPKEDKRDFICAECGKVVEPYTDAKGAVHSAESIARQSLIKFETLLCTGCAIKRAAEDKRNAG